MTTRKLQDDPEPDQDDELKEALKTVLTPTRPAGRARYRALRAAGRSPKRALLGCLDDSEMSDPTPSAPNADSGHARAELLAGAGLPVGSEVRIDAARMKSKRVHVLPIGPALGAILLRRLRARRLDTPLVFHHNGKPIGDWRKSWKKACEAAGVPGKLLHDFRRTAARDLLQVPGMTEKKAMAHTGHANPNVFKRYAITTPAEQRAAVEGLDARRAAMPIAYTTTVVPLKRAEGAS